MRIFFIFLITLILICRSNQQVQIKCYDCVTPLGVNDVTKFCNSSLYCKGQYCTKGFDATSNGIYHGCLDYPPIDTAGAKCKWFTNKYGTHANCYCKNIDFCNHTDSQGHPVLFALMLLLTLVIFVFP